MEFNPNFAYIITNFSHHKTEETEGTYKER
jgi:hypothetical protein